MIPGIRVTLGLAAAGAVFGAIAALVIAGAIILMMKTPPAGLFLGAAVAAGAATGAFLFPFTLWRILRHVPIGRALLGIFTGSVLGGLAGGALFVYGRTGIQPVVLIAFSASFGYGASLAALAVTAKRAAKSTAAADTPA